MKSVPQDIRELQRLVKAGKLFAVEDWIKEGRAVKPPEPGGRSKSVLVMAAETGFHSIVEVLLRAGGWTAKDLATALEAARSSKHFEVAAMLQMHGAAPVPLDFQESCEKLDLFMIERHLREGIDPNQGNVPNDNYSFPVESLIVVLQQCLRICANFQEGSTSPWILPAVPCRVSRSG